MNKKGRKPEPYGPRVCPTCAEKLVYRVGTPSDDRHVSYECPQCGWRGELPEAEKRDKESGRDR